jgi:diadenosine tetraphosphate (Ap4A) HIT family hydrolase/5-methylcytosine-specific restriction endonuclease McrA
LSEEFERLKKYILEDMRMSHIYQPVMLDEILGNNGSATVDQIAGAILRNDPTQIEYFSNIVKNMVGDVLTKRRGITERSGNNYHLIGADKLTPEQVTKLRQLCLLKIEEFLERRGKTIWEHRRRGHRPISGTTRFSVLKRAAFRCELCGISADEKNLEVDHIHPKSLGGKDEISNFQALCYSCNASKRNTDKTDFREYKTLYAQRKESCLFCEIETTDRSRIILENELAYVIADGFPVTPGHSLIIPKRHTPDYFSLTQPEVNAINALLQERRAGLLEGDPKITGFNIGMNCGEDAGQTIFHCHVHLIPRRSGDVENPRGGVRHIIPGKGYY